MEWLAYFAVALILIWIGWKGRSQTGTAEARWELLARVMIGLVGLALALWLTSAVAALVDRDPDRLGEITATVSGLAAGAVFVSLAASSWFSSKVPWLSNGLFVAAACGAAAAAGLWVAIATLVTFDVDVEASQTEPIVLGCAGLVLGLAAGAVRLRDPAVNWLRQRRQRMPSARRTAWSFATIAVAAALAAWLIVAGAGWRDYEIDGWSEALAAVGTGAAIVLGLLLVVALGVRCTKAAGRYGVGRALIDLVAVGAFVSVVVASGFVLAEALALAEQPNKEGRISLERAMAFVAIFGLLAAAMLATRRSTPPGPTEVTAVDIQDAAGLSREAADYAKSRVKLASDAEASSSDRAGRIAAVEAAAASTRIAARAGGDAAATLMRSASDVSFARMVQSLDKLAKQAWRDHVTARRAAKAAASRSNGDLAAAVTAASAAAASAEKLADELERVADAVTAVAEVAPPPVLSGEVSSPGTGGEGG